ncbi:replicative DNA helicase [Saccharibacillus sp. JS10]|uniref:replicative DNA helicase n=1 Tax=Saccharibacillus sp. JS10 TaxID=2950552 RepID=UPI0021099246|nr:replicative DNA helicase [Saccharibacillus sp. JS10]MCQ4085940.1 replicative DNA helicase [Saccharibacillus sp. JS10]
MERNIEPESTSQRERIAADVDVNAVLADFPMRMDKLALFDPLFELGRQRKTDLDGKPIAMMELGLLTLLFFFEKKLLRSRKTSAREHEQFLTEATQGLYRLEATDVKDIVNLIIRVFRPADGLGHQFAFFDLSTGETRTARTSILKADGHDSQTVTQYYTLDEDGLELVFATKEFYLEFQLSIHQLLLRKQLEKGEFQGALRQIDEMHIDVDTLRERITRIESEIKRSIVSEDTFQRYKNLLEDIDLRLNRESEEFKELLEFVRETRERIYADRELPRHQKAYELIVRIAVELEGVHHEHTRLLQQSYELGNQALRAAKESMYYTGMNAFSFEHEVGAFIFGKLLPPDSMEGVIAPFIGLEQAELWSPLTVFAQQQVSGRGEEFGAQQTFMEMDEAEEQAFAKQRRTEITMIIRHLMNFFDEKNREQVELESFIEWLREKGEAELLSSRGFYECWLILHQRSPISHTGWSDSGGENRGTGGLQEAIAEELQGRALNVTEIGKVIRVTPRYEIQNMRIERTEDEDAV